ncbi:hypothetical protein BCR37DRAFT_380793 [Protomyces lactucae-debilis]|uniref:RRM domain-containing protein n=1 Tax=Protomyces lactucae-debilis TaxID=2754530 RepID=A0A1Y2FAI0_PROLT|nr:uncharacterized protein BCR37DRAFT_380793 [Protomyces lactucae-debilis]ORY80919.1 hypothetical protein BCR37DRAFT_380793 [Protomyces lactucae-debilis]
MSDRDRSQSPRRDRRSASPRRDDEDRDERMPDRDAGRDHSERRHTTENPGTNLFVTGIATRIDETELREIFSQFGQVESVQIMADPHTKESRGFGFVSMATADEAEAARDGLSGQEKQGRVMSVEKARRARPRTPTPGKYFGPPKREERRGPPGRSGGGYRDRYDDRRGGDYRGGGGRGRDYDSRDRYDDRRGGDSRGRRDYDDRRYDDYPPRRSYGGGSRDRDSYSSRPRDEYRDDYARSSRDDRDRYERR